ncbi:UDP-glycosyltransferase 82A1 isoform X2 [Tripterygium wilfordii]|uniref:UDP-glycosyltransferase 82A1 isoform X2 n=1 Tax=Tripterygium wilfordii TaxID=458696 RepID=UPI0018F801C2|nr:UDP-glycosyltransferase 82A1 isoform X2 [Tripterygium wilfordii]
MLWRTTCQSNWRELYRVLMKMEKKLCAYIIVDLLASWAIDVANRCGIPVAGFWPAMLASYRLVVAIPDMVRTGIISATGNPQNLRHHIALRPFQPNQPKLWTGDLPWLIGTPQARKSRFNFWVRVLDRSSTLPWILVNSFSNESLSYEENYFTETTQLGQPMILPVTGSYCKHSVPKSPSLWEEDMASLKWLETQKPKSVLYISFGSWVSPIGESKVKTLALTLESLGQPFIWVLGSNWRQGLPNGFIQRVSKQGKIVSWAPQVEILNHRAVGGYLTHCGWNSTMEAIQCGMPLLCYPIAGDQFVNCKFIVQVWRIGVKIDGFGLKDVEEGLKKVVEDEEMNERLMKVRDRVVGEKSSLKAKININAFIDDLNRSTA